jgi:hypothetical protein
VAKEKRVEEEREQEALAEKSAAIAADPAQEKAACTPIPVHREYFNDKAVIPYGCTVGHVYQAMTEFVNFIGFINVQLNDKGLRRFESMLMPANFSSMVGEFMGATIPKYCGTLAKNTYHNGHPDLLPKGKYPNNSVQHGGADGIEIKGSRYPKGWQGHNAEDCWLMVFYFDSNRPVDLSEGIGPKPFRFIRVYGAELKKADWKFSPRKEGSRRTPTASVTPTGYEKMVTNWIYHDPGVPPDENLYELLGGD